MQPSQMTTEPRSSLQQSSGPNTHESDSVITGTQSNVPNEQEKPAVVHDTQGSVPNTQQSHIIVLGT